MSNSVQKANLQLEDFSHEEIVEYKSSQKIDTIKDDLDLIKLVLGNLTMHESEEAFRLYELMLEDCQIWQIADSKRRLRFLIEELMRKKDPLFMGCAKVLFKYLEDLKLDTKDIRRDNWSSVRSRYLEIISDYIPSRADKGLNRIPDPNSFSSFLSWVKEVKELLPVDLLT